MKVLLVSSVFVVMTANVVHIVEIVLVIKVGYFTREFLLIVWFEGLAGELKLWEELLGWLLAIVVVSEGLFKRLKLILIVTADGNFVIRMRLRLDLHHLALWELWVDAGL